MKKILAIEKVEFQQIKDLSSPQCQFVMVKDVRLRCANIGVYFRGTIWAVTQKELPDKPATAEGAEKAATARLKR